MKKLLFLLVGLFATYLILSSIHIAPMKSESQVLASTGSETYTVTGPPTVSVSVINQVLAGSNSPATGKGQALYDLGIKYGIDPAFALAFFWKESFFGTQGEARVTRSLGNLRCVPDYACVDLDRGGYASFPTWEQGFEAWYRLIRQLYINTWHCMTVKQIIPKYAPSRDNNNESLYIAHVEQFVDQLRHKGKEYQ